MIAPTTIFRAWIEGHNDPRRGSDDPCLRRCSGSHRGTLQAVRGQLNGEEAQHVDGASAWRSGGNREPCRSRRRATGTGPFLSHQELRRHDRAQPEPQEPTSSLARHGRMARPQQSQAALRWPSQVQGGRCASPGTSSCGTLPKLRWHGMGSDGSAPARPPVRGGLNAIASERQTSAKALEVHRERGMLRAFREAPGSPARQG
jgi:hypothetical protein